MTARGVVEQKGWQSIKVARVAVLWYWRWVEKWRGFVLQGLGREGGKARGQRQGIGPRCSLLLASSSPDERKFGDK